MKKFLFFLFFFFTLNATAAPEQKLTVLLDWFPNPDHAPLIVANELGYFKEQGLSVELIGPADPTDPPKLVAAKKADIGITYQPDFMEQVDRGLPLIRIGTLIDKPLNALVTLKGNGITTVADLKGKRIGTTNTSGLSNIMLKTMLKKQGLSIQDVNLINVRYNLTQALLSHQVDAVTGLMRNVEVPMLEAKQQAVVTFFPEKNGVPSYSELIFICHVTTIHDPRYLRFLAAVKKGVQYVQAHPRESWQLFAKRYPESNNDANRDSWFSTVPYFASNPTSFNSATWQQFGIFMQQNQLIKTLQPMSHYAVIVPLEHS